MFNHTALEITVPQCQALAHIAECSCSSAQHIWSCFCGSEMFRLLKDAHRHSIWHVSEEVNPRRRCRPGERDRGEAGYYRLKERASPHWDVSCALLEIGDARGITHTHTHVRELTFTHLYSCSHLHTLLIWENNQHLETFHLIAYS